MAVTSSGPTWAELTWEEPVSHGFPPSSSTRYVVRVTLKREGEEGTTRLTPPTPALSVNITDLLPNSNYDFSVETESALGSVTARSPPSATVRILTAATGKSDREADPHLLTSGEAAVGSCEINTSYSFAVPLFGVTLGYPSFPPMFGGLFHLRELTSLPFDVGCVWFVTLWASDRVSLPLS